MHSGKTFLVLLFTLLIACGIAGTVNAEPVLRAPEFFMGGSANQTVFADFDNDGDLDMASVDYSNNAVMIYINDGGGLVSGISYTVQTGPAGIATGDFNGDSFLDIVVANSGAENSVSVLLNNADGSPTFASPTHFAMGASAVPYGVGVGDFNNDGKLDFVVTLSGLSQFKIMNGDGAGGFTPGTLRTTDTAPRDIVVADFNNDGKSDIAITCNTGINQINVSMNNGADLSTPIGHSMGLDPRGIDVGDFNGDGKLDIIACSYNAASIYYLAGDGAGGFAAATSFSKPGFFPVRCKTGDYNNDGKPDVVVVGFSSTTADNRFLFMPGDGAGTFSTAEPAFYVGSGTEWINAADVNADGKLDLAISLYGGNGIAFVYGEGAGQFGISNHYKDGNSGGQYSATADFDNDGKNDLAIVYSTSYVVRIYRGNGDNTVTPLVVLSDASITGPTFITTGDVDNDGNADVIGIESANQMVFVFRGLGNGSFAAAQKISTPSSSPKSCVLKDFNGDGKLDVAVGSSLGANIDVFLGNGDGTFTYNNTYGSAGFQGIAAGDFNKDGKIDLVTTDNISNQIRIFIGNGLGGFTPTTVYPTGAGPQAIATGDVNNDGNMDVITTDVSANTFTVIIGDGAGSFTSSISGNAYGTAYDIKIKDINGDGKLDVVLPVYTTNSLHVYFGDGTGNYLITNMQKFTTVYQPYSCSLGDFDNNLLPDVTVVGGSYFSISKNATTLAGPAISNYTAAPASGNAPLTVAFAYDATPGTAPIVSYKIDLNNDGLFDEHSDVAPGVATYVYSTPGVYTINLKVTDANSIVTTASLNITVTSPAPTTTKTLTGTVFAGGVGLSGVPVYAQSLNGAYFQSATTGTGGVFSFTLTGGGWAILPVPSPASGYVFLSGPSPVYFLPDASVETKTVNFTLTPAGAKIRGTLVPPGGASIPTGQVYLLALNSDWASSMTVVYDDGTFEIPVPAGSYSLFMIVLSTTGSNWALPIGAPSVLKAGEIKDLGNILLIEKKQTINGQVVCTAGSPVENATIIAINMNVGDVAKTSSDASGNYSLRVLEGPYIIFADGSSTGSPYFMTGAPEFIEVVSGSSPSLNFTMILADGTITGTIVNSSGNPITDIFGVITLNAGAEDLGYGGSVSNGTFSFNVPAGTYNINIALPPGASYTATTGTTVTVASGATESVSIPVLSNDATISGYLKTSAGATVTGVEADIFVTNKYGALQSTSVDTATGQYSLKVAAGTWYLGHFLDPNATGYKSIPDNDNSITTLATQTVTHDVQIEAATGTISGTVQKPDGTGFGFIWISANVSGTGETGAENEFANGIEADEDGAFTLKLTPGTYTLTAYGAAATGYINPDKETLTVAGGETKNVILKFGSPDAVISGTVKQDGVGVRSYVSAWSDTGGYAEAFSDETDGTYTLNVGTNAKWRVRAVREAKTSVYDSSPCGEDVEVGAESVTFDMTLTQNERLAKPSGKSISFAAANMAKLELSDGTLVIIPSRAMATAGNVTVTATPYSSVPRQLNSMPLGFAYQFRAYDGSGQEIKRFNSPVMIVIPYSPNLIIDAGIAVEDLIPCYWDDQTESWRKLGNVMVDKDNHTITLTTTHFTDYSLNSTAALAFAGTTASTAGSDYLTNYGGGGSGCFIATAAYEGRRLQLGNKNAIVKNYTGSYLLPTKRLKKLNKLRRFRDDVLMESKTGRQFVRAYYTLGPVVSGAIRGNEPLKRIVRETILPEK